MTDEGTRRRRNPEQTRGVIIGALLELLHEGDFQPTTKSLAARAGVSERNIFVHFPGRDELLVAATDAQSEKVEALIARPDPAWPLTRRVDLAVEQSAAIYAHQRNPRLLGLLASPAVPGIDERMRLTDKRIRDALDAAFAPELDGDPELLDLIDAALGWPTRHHLVERRALGTEAASAAIRRTLLALLTAER
ncbi:helix-turn-helix domain-containing protein [Nocardia sp. NPDC050712]|uniref:TetR/AcrR family transcriptional regulator n=1 Tax=Nocardia sp. NPDC050712 TaxID=3155518 RepID=UPI0033D46B75